MKNLNKEERAVIILPSYWNLDKNFIYPNNKEELLHSLKTNVKFSRIKFPSHYYTDFDKFENETNLEEFYDAHEFNSKNDQEPYFISTNDIPYYNERLRGCGLDKIEQTQSTFYLQNYKAFIWNKFFLIHQPHIKSTRVLCPDSQSQYSVHSARTHFIMTFNEFPRFNIVNKKNQTVLQKIHFKKYFKKKFFYFAYNELSYFDIFDINSYDYFNINHSDIHYFDFFGLFYYSFLFLTFLFLSFFQRNKFHLNNNNIDFINKNK
jgi:hypothetical protein